MTERMKLTEALRAGAYDAALSRIYAQDGSEAALSAARSRALRLAETFEKTYGAADCTLFSAPGRTEIGGNHTDHQHGHVLCGSVSADMLACAAQNGSDEIRVLSDGYPPVTVSLRDLAPNKAEFGTTAALVRGVAAGFAERGFSPVGFDVCVNSAVLSGSGLSSSAAFEVLTGTILAHFVGCTIEATELAKLAQKAENEFFGKPCGLMDQTACAVGGAIAVDFNDPAAPVVTRADYDFTRSGHKLCIIDTRSDHADLTDDYAAIPREMSAVAACFGKRFLRDVAESDFRAAIPEVRKTCGDRAVLRAIHFYAEDRRAVQEAEALQAGDFSRFLSIVNESGLSSELLLQNIWSPAHPERQAVSLALTVGRELLNGAGAIRVHGGGFAGTIQAFVPDALLTQFREGIEAVLGEGTCHVYTIRPVGGWVFLP
ncbi:MAG: galactokinase [Oscillospiraceae bacterium]|nr:galactokinase [Oscillospiraceae bacterium]